jgi:hypothetical protein
METGILLNFLAISRFIYRNLMPAHVLIDVNVIPREGQAADSAAPPSTSSG